jgi:hypothetical protein
MKIATPFLFCQLIERCGVGKREAHNTEAFSQCLPLTHSGQVSFFAMTFGDEN